MPKPKSYAPVRIMVTTIAGVEFEEGRTAAAIDVTILEYEDEDAATVAADVINSADNSANGFKQAAVVIDQ